MFSDVILQQQRTLAAPGHCCPQFMAREMEKDWRVVAGDRLEARQREQPAPWAGSLPDASARVKQLAREMEQKMKGGKRSWKPVERPLAAADDVDAAALMTAQREYHKTGTGLIKSTFEPQRHTWFVAGRPVQVLHEIICRARHNVVNVFAPAPCVCAAVCVCLCVRVCVCVCMFHSMFGQTCIPSFRQHPP